MNIIKHELKANFKAFIIWTAALSLIFLAASTEFEAYYNNDQIKEMFESFSVFFEALGGNLNDMTTPAGFLTLLSFYIFLPLSIYSGLLGSGIISKEEKDKTAEFLFSLPVSRSKVLLSKITAASIYSFLLVVAVIGINIIAYARFGLDQDFYQFTIYLAIGVFLTQLIFLSIGMMLSSILNQYKISGALTIGILIAAFMISMLIGVVEQAEVLKYLTPFQYFKAEAMRNGDFERVFILLTTLIIGGSITSVFYFYRKRDLFI